jgi:hypothetical protein
MKMDLNSLSGAVDMPSAESLAKVHTNYSIDMVEGGDAAADQDSATE